LHALRAVRASHGRAAGPALRPVMVLSRHGDSLACGRENHRALRLPRAFGPEEGASAPLAVGVRPGLQAWHPGVSPNASRAFQRPSQWFMRVPWAAAEGRNHGTHVKARGCSASLRKPRHPATFDSPSAASALGGESPDVVTGLCAQTCRFFPDHARKVKKTYLPRPARLRPIRRRRSYTFVRTNVSLRAPCGEAPAPPRLRRATARLRPDGTTPWQA